MVNQTSSESNSLRTNLLTRYGWLPTPGLTKPQASFNVRSFQRYLKEH
jgi:hypothetical protein